MVYYLYLSTEKYMLMRKKAHIFMNIENMKILQK